MSKLIQKAGFLNPKRAGRYMNYIATRDGVELLDENADSIYMRYAASARISSEFNNPPVPPDGTDLPRQCHAALQSNGHPYGFQAAKKADAKAAGDGP